MAGLMSLGFPPGMLERGNLDLNARKVYHGRPRDFPDQDFRTENSMSGNVDGKEVLIPTVVNGQQLTEDAAWDHFFRTGENLGWFADPASADKYAEKLHQRQGDHYQRLIAKMLMGK